MMSKIKPQLFCTRKKEFGKILPVKNVDWNPAKPIGGLWTSTYTPNSEYPSAWVRWCSYEQPEKFPYNRTLFPYASLDWEEIAKHYDAIMLTEKGEKETRYTNPSLYGWDCESTLWFRNVFKKIKKIKWRKLDGTN